MFYGTVIIRGQYTDRYTAWTGFFILEVVILMDIILLGIGVGFGLYVVVSLLGYSIREMIKLFE